MTDNYWNNKNNSSSGGGYKPLHDVEVKQPVKREETLRERYKRQQLQRIEELKFTAEDEARCAVHRERVLKEREIRGESSDFLDAINDIVCAVKDATNDLSQSQKKVEVPKFNIDEVLENPELDGIKSVKIDPISMLADDIESLVKDGKEFINNPTLVGAAGMAVTAIPGKYSDDLADFVGKYKGKDIKLNDLKMLDIQYLKRSREELDKLRKEFNNGVRKKYLIELSSDRDVVNKLKELGVPHAEINKLQAGRVPASFEVHHKLPLDDSGTNDFSNLVLIRKSPEHAALTTYQKQTTKGLTVGSVVDVKWPVPNGTVYPKK